MVPVLSSATICTLPASSSDAAVLNNIPFLAPRPLPTIMATGVASPSAQGQLITSTDIARASANPTPRPMSSHTTSVTRDIAITAGTKMPETLSATLAMGAFVADAPSTIFIICDKVVSSPTRSARQRKKPDWLMVAADTLSPAFLSTGMLSPVRADSFTALMPSTITPSTGILSPGRTTNSSPMRTCSTGTVCSLPSFTTTAVLGARFISPLSALVVLPLEIDSSILPNVIKVSIVAADSK